MLTDAGLFVLVSGNRDPFVCHTRVRGLSSLSSSLLNAESFQQHQHFTQAPSLVFEQVLSLKTSSAIQKCSFLIRVAAVCSGDDRPVFLNQHMWSALIKHWSGTCQLVEN